MKLFKYWKVMLGIAVFGIMIAVSGPAYAGGCNEAAWYPLDEQSGQTAADIVAGNDGIHKNGPTPVPGVIGHALEFDGIDDYVAVPDHPALNFGKGDLTITAYIRTESRATESLADKRDLDTGVGYVLHLYGGKLLFQLYDDISGWYNYYDPSSPDLADGEWHCVAVTVDRDEPDGGRLYADGQLIHTFNPTNRSGNITNAAELRIGKNHPNPESSSAKCFDGDIDELKLFDCSLTENEIQTICSPAPSGARVVLDMDIFTMNYDDTVSNTDIDSELTACEDDEVWVAVVAQAVTDLDTYQVEVGFDTGRLEFLQGIEDDPSGATCGVGGTENLLKKNGGTSVGFQAVEQTAGTINISNTLTGSDCNEAPEGTGIIALLKFKVLDADPDALLTLGNVFFVDCSSDNESVTDLQNGRFVQPPYPPWDFNQDGITDFVDLGLLANHWLLACGDTDWDPKYDLNGDCIVNYLDLGIFGDHWLEEGPCS